MIHRRRGDSFGRRGGSKEERWLIGGEIAHRRRGDSFRRRGGSLVAHLFIVQSGEASYGRGRAQYTADGTQYTM
jgi:hypothetical protein